MTKTFELRKVTVQDKPALIAVSGPEDGTPVLLIHGFGNTPRFANRRAMDAIAAELRAKGPVRIIAPVLPGFSGTAPLSVRAKFSDYARWCVDALAALSISGPAVVFGESMGGAVAISFAAAYPEQVLALVLFNSVGAKDLKRSQFSWIFGATASASVRRGHLQQWASSTLDAAFVLRHPVNAWFSFQEIVGADLVPQLASVREQKFTKVAVFGRNDPIVRHRSAAVFAEALDTTPTLIDADHRSFIDGHSAVLDVLAEVVASVVEKREVDSEVWAQDVIAGADAQITVADSYGTRIDGVPVVVAIHGIGLSRLTFRKLAKYIESWTSILVPDLPGFGSSKRPDRVLDIDEHAAVLSRWMDEKNLSQVVLVGHSLGAQIAVALADLRSDLVVGCVLIGPTVDIEARSVAKQSVRFVHDVWRENFRFMTGAVVSYLRAGPKTLWLTARYAIEDRIDIRLERLDIPVAIVRGELDTIAPQQWSEDLALSIKSASVHTIPEAAHVVQWSKPEAVADVVRTVATRGRAEMSTRGRQSPC